MIGASGSGKTTWWKEEMERLGERNVTVCSANDYFMNGNGEYDFSESALPAAHGFCLRKFIASVQNWENSDHTVIVDNTNTRISELAPYISISQAYHCLPRVVWVAEMNVKILAERNTHGVQAHTLINQTNRLGALGRIWPGFWPKREIILA